MAGEDLEQRLARLECRLDDLQLGVEVLIAALPEDVRTHLSAALEPHRRRLAAERPRGATEWPDEGLRRLSAAVSLIEEGLLGADPSGA